MISQQTKMTSLLIDEIVIKHEDRFIGHANKYKCTIKYEGKTGSFDFTDSVNNTNLGKEPLLKDVLSCLVSDYSFKDDCFDEFCLNLGYNNDSIKDKDIFKAVLKNAEKMNYIFRNSIEDLSKEFEDY